MSVSGVMEVIEEGIRQWPADRLKVDHNIMQDLHSSQETLII